MYYSQVDCARCMSACVYLVVLSSSASTEDIAPTVGFVNGHARLKGCNLTLLDLGGGERLREIWHNYYAEVRAHSQVYASPASATLTLEIGFGHEQFAVALCGTKVVPCMLI